MLIFTGAGVSTGSGIPDYRGPQGVWKTKQPVYYQEFMTSESARIKHWTMRVENWNMFGSARPNAVHHAIRQLELADKVECVVTQNVDGLHAAAGTSPERLVEIHGTTQKVECQGCGWLDDVAPHLEAFRIRREPPLCECGGYLKTATISFGQSLKPREIERAEQAANHCDLVIALGSTLSVRPANMIPFVAAQRGTPYVIINQGDTEHDGESFVSLRLEGDVVDIFAPAVASALRVMS
jgi:NAD-dependent deacetylase